MKTIRLPANSFTRIHAKQERKTQTVVKTTNIYNNVEKKLLKNSLPRLLLYKELYLGQQTVHYSNRFMYINKYKDR